MYALTSSRGKQTMTIMNCLSLPSDTDNSIVLLILHDKC